jgi:hypothetical protein
MIVIFELGLQTNCHKQSEYAQIADKINSRKLEIVTPISLYFNSRIIISTPNPYEISIKTKTNAISL